MDLLQDMVSDSIEVRGLTSAAEDIALFWR